MRTKFISKLIDRMTRKSQSNNDSFEYYGHLVSLQSGTSDYVDVTVYRDKDPYSGEIICFSFDYWTKELIVEYAEDEQMIKELENAFRAIYGHIKIKVIDYDEEETA